MFRYASALLVSALVFGLTALIAPSRAAAQDYSAFQLLTTNENGKCNPQRAQNDPGDYGNCCGAPGRASCTDDGLKYPWVLPTGCTIPNANEPVFPNLLITICELPPPTPEKTDLLPAQRPVAGTDFSFWVTSDLHFFRNWNNVFDQSNHPNRLNQLASNPDFTWALASETNINNLESGPIGPPTAIMVPGDLMLGGEIYQLQAYRLLWEPWLSPASIQYPVYFGLGNHDNSNLMRQYLYDRTRNFHVDRNGTGCLVDITPGCADEGNAGGTLQYSWDWHGVHMIMLGPWAGTLDNLDNQPADGADGLTWLANDLKHYVGNSGRPVIIFQHYTLYDVAYSPSTAWWYPADFHNFWTIIRDYNVVGLFSGHTHHLGMYSPLDFPNSFFPGDIIDYKSGTHVTKYLDNFVDGNGGGDCVKTLPNGPEEGCTGAHNYFMAVHVFDNVMDVGALASVDSEPGPENMAQREVWIRGGYYSLNGKPLISGYSISGLGPSGEDAVCRKRINSKFVQLPYSIENDGGVAYSGTTVIQGTFAVKVPSGTYFDFTDSCHFGAGQYKLVSSQTLHPGDRVSTTGGPLYQLQDLVLHTNVSPSTVSLGSSPTSVQVTTSRPGEEIAFTVNDIPKYLGLDRTQATTPYALHFHAIGNLAPGVETSQVELTPADPTLNPTYVPVTLSVQRVEVNTNPGHLPLFIDDQQVTAPFNTSWISGTQHRLDAHNPPTGTNTRFVFSSWSDHGQQVHYVTAAPYAPGGSGYIANFNTEYLINVTASPATGGTVTGSGWFVKDASDTILSRPAKGYVFARLSGDIHSTKDNVTVPVDRPLDVQADFAPAPSLTITGGTPLVQSGATVALPITIRNSGPGLASGLTVTISNIQVVLGSGAVSATNLPLNLGNLANGKSTSGRALFNWPSTATRVKFSITAQSNAGQIQSILTKSLNR